MVDGVRLLWAILWTDGGVKVRGEISRRELDVESKTSWERCTITKHL